MDPNTYLLIIGGVVVATGTAGFVRAIWKDKLEKASGEERSEILGSAPQPKWYHDAEKDK